jgi:DNA-binding transcriptional LysR family regulator
MEAGAAILGRGGTDDGLKGLVRLNAPPSLSQAFIVPRLAKLGAEQPGLDIDVATDVRMVSLERRETDIALRFGRPQDGDVLAKPLVNMSFGFYGIPACRRRVAEGGEPVFVGFDEANANLPEAAWLARNFPRARVAFRADNHIAQAAAAVAGGGLALLPHFIGRLEDRLQLCPLNPSPPSRELWLVTRRHDRSDRAIRAVVEQLLRLFAESRDLFEGEVQGGAVDCVTS